MKKNAYVTGAGRGLGLELVRMLLKSGHTVFAGNYLPERGGLQDLENEYGDALCILPLDIGCSQSVSKAAEIISQKTEHLNLLINNAGIAPMHDRDATIFDDFDYDEILRTFDINAVGQLRVTKSVLDLLLKPDEKRLVNITSLAGSIKLLKRENQYAYVMSKAACNIQSKLLHNSLSKHGLKVFAIHPGWMHTSLFNDDPEIMKGADFEPFEAAKLILDFVFSTGYNGDHVFFGNDGAMMEY